MFLVNFSFLFIEKSKQTKKCFDRYWYCSIDSMNIYLPCLSTAASRSLKSNMWTRSRLETLRSTPGTSLRSQRIMGNSPSCGSASTASSTWSTRRPLDITWSVLPSHSRPIRNRWVPPLIPIRNLIISPVSLSVEAAARQGDLQEEQHLGVRSRRPGSQGGNRRMFWKWLKSEETSDVEGVSVVLCADLLSEPVSAGQTLPGPQDPVLWRGALHLLHPDRGQQAGGAHRRLLLQSETTSGGGGGGGESNQHPPS